MGTSNQGGRELPGPDAAGMQQDKKDGLWKGWESWKDPKDVPQENGGQRSGAASGSVGPVAEPGARPGTPEGPPPRTALWASMATRGGTQAPTLQQRGVHILIKPGQLDNERPEAEAEGQEDGGGQEAPAGSSGDGQAHAPGNGWEKYKPSGAYASGPTKGYQGIPEGSERLGNSNMWRTPGSDFMYHQGWEPEGEDVQREGRKYLTSVSEHANEVHRDQMDSRRQFLDLYGYCDGYDGITFRQYLEALSRVQSCLSNGQLAATGGGFARWQAEAMGSKAVVPDFDDSWCLCGLWVFASATSCVCGLPTGRNRKGDWQCTGCFKTNFGSNGKGVQWCRKCKKMPRLGRHPRVRRRHGQ